MFGRRQNEVAVIGAQKAVNDHPDWRDQPLPFLLEAACLSPGIRGLDVEMPPTYAPAVSLKFENRRGTICNAKAGVKGGDLHAALINVLEEYERLY